MASPIQSGLTPDVPDHNGHTGSLNELRELLVGPEQRELARLRARLEDPELRVEEMSQIVAEAIALRARRDRSLLRALQPMVEEALKISVERDPRMIADSLYPIIGQAVRKAVAHALRGMVESLNSILERSFSWESLKWRLEAARTGRSFGEIALMRSLRFHVEQVFLVHRETGLLLGHVAAKGSLVQDSDLVSGMLTAIQDFARDSFTTNKSEDLDTVHFDQHVIWILHGPSALIAGVVSGTPPLDLRNFFQRTLERIHVEFGQPIAAYSGNAEAVSGVTPYLQACLLGSQSSTTKKSYRWLWPVLALVLLFLTGLFFVVRQQLRWNRYVEQLRSEPGIILASEESHWNSYSAVGLRDPLAADPELLLRQSGLDPAKVKSRWEPYSSLDPVFATARKLLSGKESIEEQVIRFGVASSKLEGAELAKLDVIAAQLMFLNRQASGLASKISVEITGHTDRSGQETANALLSQRRADEVRRALIERGVPTEMLVSEGVGASRPSASGSDSFLEDLNRRVTFTVNLPSLQVQR